MLSSRSSRHRKRVDNDTSPQRFDERKGSKRQRNLDNDATKGGERTTERDIWDSFREEHIDSIEQLPLYLHRNFTLMNELDRQSRASLSNLLPALQEYIEHRRAMFSSFGCRPIATFKEEVKTTKSSSLSPGITMTGISADDATYNNAHEDTKAAHILPTISSLAVNLMHASEEKINLAQATYDSVDRHVRILDRAIKEQAARTQSDPHLPSVNGQAGTRPVSNPSIVRATFTNPQNEVERPCILAANDSRSSPYVPLPKRLSRSRTSTYYVTSLDTSDDRGPGLMKAENRGPTILNVPSNLNRDVQTVGPPAIVLVTGDMPIDPHEPRYCYCNQVSWGEMIACDSSECEREWFHLNCAGLSEAPKGKTKWYCNDCKQKMSSGGNRKR